MGHLRAILTPLGPTRRRSPSHPCVSQELSLVASHDNISRCGDDTRSGGVDRHVPRSGKTIHGTKAVKVHGRLDGMQEDTYPACLPWSTIRQRLEAAPRQRPTVAESSMRLVATLTYTESTMRRVMPPPYTGEHYAQSCAFHIPERRLCAALCPPMYPREDYAQSAASLLYRGETMRRILPPPSSLPSLTVWSIHTELYASLYTLGVYILGYMPPCMP